MTILLAIICSFITGVVTLLGFILYRMMSNDGWDDSNITNALRLLSHVTLHPEDFGKMYYLTDLQYRDMSLTNTDPIRRPFWYVDKDELSKVVDTRP